MGGGSGIYPSGLNVYSNSPCQPDVKMMRSVPSAGLQLLSLDSLDYFSRRRFKMRYGMCILSLFLIERIGCSLVINSCED